MTDIENRSSEEKVVDAMKAEAIEAGIPSIFPDDEPAPKVEEPTKDPEQKVEPKAEPKVEEPKTTPRSRVPFRERMKAEVRGEYEPKLKEKDDEIARLKALKEPDVKGPDLDAEMKAFATEFNLDEEQVKKLVGLSRKGLEEEMKTIRTQLDEKEQREKSLLEDKEIADQEKVFNTEFSTSVIPEIKKAYPNASIEQIAKAQETMEDLAFTEKYHSVDLDYVFMKEKETFEKILFSPKVKGFESSSTPEGDLENKDKDPFAEFKPQNYKDVEKEAKRMADFAESLPDSRFSVG